MDFTKKFTTSTVLDAMTAGDTTASMIGFVERIDSNPQSPGARYYKVILSNNDKKRVQVVAWKDNIPKLSVIETGGTVVQVKNATVAIPKQSKYNHGNMSYELQVLPSTTIKKLGVFEAGVAPRNATPVAMADVPQNYGSMIVVKGYVKSPFRHYVTNTRNYYVGCIADIQSKLKLEVNTVFDSSELLCLGDYVAIRGIAESQESSPSILRIQDAAQIEKDDSQANAEFVDLLMCYSSV